MIEDGPRVVTGPAGPREEGAEMALSENVLCHTCSLQREVAEVLLEDGGESERGAESLLGESRDEKPHMECRYCLKFYCRRHTQEHLRRGCQSLRRLLHQLAVLQKAVSLLLASPVVLMLCYVTYRYAFTPLRDKYGLPHGAWVRGQPAWYQLIEFLISIPIVLVVGAVGLTGALIIAASIFFLLDHWLWGTRYWHLAEGESATITLPRRRERERS